MSRFKRDFRKWLHRNKIKNVKAWLDGKKIKSFDALQAFCNSNDFHLSMTEEQCNNQFFQPVKKPGTEQVVSESDSTQDKVAPKTWEIPAAERPLKKSSNKSKKHSVRKQKGSKNRKRSDK